MPKQPNVTDADIIACHVAADNFLMEMQDIAGRIQKGYVDRIEDPVAAAREFTLIARAASNMVVMLLFVDQTQKQKDEIAALRASQ